MKRSKRRPLRDYVIGAVLLLLLAYLVLNLFDIYEKQKVARMTAAEANQQVEDLDARYKTLETHLRDLETERGREASYREQFGVARPGEEVIIVVATEAEAPQTGLTWWRKFLGFFGL